MKDIKWLLLSLRKTLSVSCDIQFQNWMLSTFLVSMITIIPSHFGFSYRIQFSASLSHFRTPFLNGFAEVAQIYRMEDPVFAIADRNDDLFLALVCIFFAFPVLLEILWFSQLL